MDYQNQTLHRSYQLRFQDSASYRDAVWKVLCANFFSRYISTDATVLDLGAGWGEFINNITVRERAAMDLNHETGQRLSKNVRFINQDCSQTWPLDSESLDVVFTSNFLEHLPDKMAIERAIAEAYRCLKQDGTLICLGPNIKFVPGAYWDFWDHYVPLTDASIAEVLKLKGFTIQTQIDRFLPYTMSTGSKPHLAFLKLYLRLPMVWRFIGKQFLVVAKKQKVLSAAV
jgi:ubiquinone/menaquinone biosynthesis C-methylase UbiE